MEIDTDAIANSLAEKITSGPGVLEVTNDGTHARFEGSLDQARALQILQQIQSTERRRKKVVPGFVGLRHVEGRFSDG